MYWLVSWKRRDDVQRGGDFQVICTSEVMVERYRRMADKDHEVKDFKVEKKLIYPKKD